MQTFYNLMLIVSVLGMGAIYGASYLWGGGSSASQLQRSKQFVFAQSLILGLIWFSAIGSWFDDSTSWVKSGAAALAGWVFGASVGYWVWSGKNTKEDLEAMVGRAAWTLRETSKNYGSVHVYRNGSLVKMDAISKRPIKAFKKVYIQGYLADGTLVVAGSHSTQYANQSLPKGPESIKAGTLQ